MKDALFMMRTARVLANVVDQLDDIDMADRDTKGDLYEYMLGKVATAGQNGQFRTPRHIIRLMVDMPHPRRRTSSPIRPAARPASSSRPPSIRRAPRRPHLQERPGPSPVQRGHRPRLRLRHHHAAHRQHEHTAFTAWRIRTSVTGIRSPSQTWRPQGDDAERYSLALANPPFSLMSVPLLVSRYCASRVSRPV